MWSLAILLKSWGSNSSNSNNNLEGLVDLEDEEGVGGEVVLDLAGDDAHALGVLEEEDEDVFDDEDLLEGEPLVDGGVELDFVVEPKE